MNFPNFPLYSSLCLKTEEFAELKGDEKDILMESIKDMNDEQHRIVYALIRAYHLDHDHHQQEIPYGGKNLKSGLKFDVDCLPSRLQAILNEFSKLAKN